MDKRVCFVSSRPGFIQSKKSFVMDWANGRLVKTLIDEGLINSVAFFADPVVNKSYDFEISTNRVYPLPFPFSYKGGMVNSIRILKILKQIEKEHDLLIVQLPFASFIPLLFLRKPVIYHVCANVLTAAANPFKYRGPIRLLSLSFARLMTTCFRRLFADPRNALIVNGNELGKLYQKFNPRIVVSSSIGERDIIPAHRIGNRQPGNFAILFVGRPSMEKGIDILLRAFKKLIDDGKDVSLTMIGVSREELSNGLLDFEISERYLNKINFHGFVPWGEQFRKIVQDCHCLVLCSVSEGTPRVIIEAMALGCPVIATDVGGVSTSIEHNVNGILVPYGKPEALSQAIEVLMDNEEFRQQLALNALEKVHDFTLDKFSEVFIEEITSQKP